ncbi:MAG: FAD-dependent oxidoreductase, partial [Rhizobiales bacterium]|nr:FAD-dependent oxidoreductase [Hyphomicrobiales bacterium]
MGISRMSFRASALALGIVAGLAGAARADEVTPAHLAAAKEAIDAAQNFKGFDNLLPLLAQQTQNRLIRLRPDQHQLISQVVDAESLALATRRVDLDNDVARIMAKYFSEEELQQIAAFYKTPAGIKFATLLPKVRRVLGVSLTMSASSEFDVDLFVIGAGSGGVRAGRIAASHGARVMVAEEYRVGGTCVVRGCVPKKLFVYASHFAEEFEDAAGFGWTVGEARFDWPSLVAAKDREIDRLNGAYIRNLERSGATLVQQRAVVEGPHAVRLGDGRLVTAGIILVATGGTPYVDPTLPGHELAITSNEAFHLPRLPERIAIVGGGFIAVEFAGIFNGLGVETTIIYRGEQLLRGFDDELRTMLAREIGKKGVRVVLGDTPGSIERAGDGLRLRTRGGLALEVGEVMLATGRRPNTARLGLESAGVALDAAGAVMVDAYSQSNVPSVYAIGDVTNRINLTPVAIREGHA